MSAASDLIAEVKQSLAKATAGVKRFEGELGEIGVFTDLAHLNIAAIHLREFAGSLEAQASQPDAAPEEPATVEKLDERQWTHDQTEEVFDTKREATADAEPDPAADLIAPQPPTQ